MALPHLNAAATVLGLHPPCRVMGFGLMLLLQKIRMLFSFFFLFSFSKDFSGLFLPRRKLFNNEVNLSVVKGLFGGELSEQQKSLLAWRIVVLLPGHSLMASALSLSHEWKFQPSLHEHHW